MMTEPPTDEELAAWAEWIEEPGRWPYHTTKRLIAEVRRLRALIPALRLALAHERSQPSTGDREVARRCRGALEWLIHEMDGSDERTGSWNSAAVKQALAVARDLLIDTETREDEPELPEAVILLRKLDRITHTTIYAAPESYATSALDRVIVASLEWLRTARLGGQRAEWVACSERLPEKGSVVLMLASSEVRPGRRRPAGSTTDEFVSHDSRGFEWLPEQPTHWMPLPPLPSPPLPLPLPLPAAERPEPEANP